LPRPDSCVVSAITHSPAAQLYNQADSAKQTAALYRVRIGQANTTATQAIQEKEKVKKDAKETLNEVLPLVTGSQQQVKTLGAAATPQVVDLARAQREIEQLLHRLG